MVTPIDVTYLIIDKWTNIQTIEIGTEIYGTNNILLPVLHEIFIPCAQICREKKLDKLIQHRIMSFALNSWIDNKIKSICSKSFDFYNLCPHEILKTTQIKMLDIML